jgi:ATP-dependent RNA helicase SUPV3L1/SUV3
VIRALYVLFLISIVRELLTGRSQEYFLSPARRARSGDFAKSALACERGFPNISSRMTNPHTQTTGRVLAVLGPTNTGKTHYAIERIMGHATGMIGLPLRLLAREVYERIASVKGEHAVALITGEEKIVPREPRYWVATVESMPMDVSVECLAVDEIQLAGDPDRGHIFTDRLLHARGVSETIFLGSDTMRPLIQRLVPNAQFITRPRFSDLAYTGPRKLTRLPRRSAIVAFSAQSVYEIAELVRRQRGGAAVVLGALSPRTRNAQVALYQNGDVDFMVATDAIGMGLNMDIDHVAFAETDKFDGAVRRGLRPNELAQIAGRAGRHMNDGTFGVTGDATALDSEVIEAVENHRFDPVRVAQWRNPTLDFTSLAHLHASLEALPPSRGLVRARAADDVAALRLTTEVAVVKDAATGGTALKLLWDVCQIPDFRKVTIDEHAQLLTNIYLHLMSHDGVLPPDWIGGHIDRLDVAEGEIDTIAARIAHVRTWTYVANRSGWLADPEHWQARARAVEDKLSDALHERLTQRFVDRRTSVLMRRLREDDEFVAAIDEDGEVLVEGEYVGRLQGFSFVADPRAMGVHGKAIRAAALKGLSSEIADRAHKLSIAPEAAITLSEHGRLWWNGGIVGRLAKGADPLSPRVEMLADDLLNQTARERALYRLQGWVNGHIDKVLAPIMALQQALKEKPPTPEVSRAETDAATLEPAPPETRAPAQDDPGAATTETPEPEADIAPAQMADDEAAGDAIVGDGTGGEATVGEATGVSEQEQVGEAEQASADAAGEAAAETAEDSSAAAGAAAPEPAATRKPAAAAPENRPLTGQARGLVFLLIESLGATARSKAAEQIKGMSQDDRAPLRRLGVRFGQYSIFLPALIKPSAARLKALLWAVHHGLQDVPPPPQAGLTSVAIDPSTPGPFLEAAGFRLCGQRAVRLDMLERLADLIRSKGEKGQPPDKFEASSDMMSILGAGPDELSAVLRGLGYRETQTQKEDGTSVTIWLARPKHEGRHRREAAAKDGGRRSMGAGQRRPDGPRQPGSARAGGERTGGERTGGERTGGDRGGGERRTPAAPDASASARSHGEGGAPPRDRPERSNRDKERKKGLGDVAARAHSSKPGSGGERGRDAGGDRRGPGKGPARPQEPKVFSTERNKAAKGPDPDSPFAILAQLKAKS